MHRTEIYGNVRFTKDTWTIGAWIHFRKYAEKLIYMEIIQAAFVTRIINILPVAQCNYNSAVVIISYCAF